MDIAFHLCWQYCNKYESPTTRFSFSLHNGLGGTFIWLITCQQPLPSVWSSNGYTKVILRIACMPTARGSPLSPRFTEQPLRDRKSIIIAEIGYCGGNKIVRWVHSCKLLPFSPIFASKKKHFTLHALINSFVLYMKLNSFLVEISVGDEGWQTNGSTCGRWRAPCRRLDIFLFCPQSKFIPCSLSRGSSFLSYLLAPKELL